MNRGETLHSFTHCVGGNVLILYLDNPAPTIGGAITINNTIIIAHCSTVIM